MAKLSLSGRDYPAADKFLGTRDARTIGNNTRLERRKDAIAVVLHSTDAVTLWANGDVELNSGGWRTVTTMSRIMEFIPPGYYVQQRKFVWFLVHRTTEVKDKFEDGVRITRDGRVSLPAVS